MHANNPVVYMIFHVVLITFPFTIPLVHLALSPIERLRERVAESRAAQAVATSPSSAGVASTSLFGSTRTV